MAYVRNIPRSLVSLAIPSAGHQAPSAPTAGLFHRWRIAAGLVAAGATFIVAFSSAPAYAGSAGNCAGSFWGYFTQDVCVNVTTGGTNTHNHTQWVSTVEVANKVGDGGRLEAWGANFYVTSSASAKVWTVNRWEPSGSGVCGAIAPVQPSDSREVTCITIHA